jgi:ABC-type sugar transport system ATPase subunit
MRARARRARARELIDAYDVRPPEPDRAMATLSGGNQQKAILAKWIHREPVLLILDEPAQGIDIGAKTEVFRVLEAASRRGIALIVMSEEFDDLVHLCDRVLLMKQGHLIADLSGDRKTRQQISELVYQEAITA